MSATVIDGSAGTLSYYLYDLSQGGVGGLQQTITSIPLSSYLFTNAYLGRSAFAGDNSTNGSIDEFRIYNNAQSAAAECARRRSGWIKTSVAGSGTGLDIVPGGRSDVGLLARPSAQTTLAQHNSDFQMPNDCTLYTCSRSGMVKMGLLHGIVTLIFFMKLLVSFWATVR